MEPKLITLLSDFGHKDPFVGIMKGVIFGINPDARVVDLSHGIPPQDLMAGAMVLRHAAPYFPPGTIHVGVVDPGVGTERRALLIEADGAYFIGPDNGLLSLALDEKKPGQIVELNNAVFHLRPTSSTFHGRDIFAPVAGYLSLGIRPADFGTLVGELTRLRWPKATAVRGGLEGEVVYIDGFGNLVTNIEDRALGAFRDHLLTFRVGAVTIRGLARNYAGGDDRGYLALINSWGLLEIAQYQGPAQRASGARLGDKIFIQEGPAGEEGPS
jgi:S-adenosyl-L-methionine hydrolase (adenosine-forming)